MFKSFIKSISNNRTLKGKTRRVLSLIFLSISGILSLLNYSKKGLLPLEIFEKSFSFRPTLITGFLGIILISPLYLRRIFKWNRSVYSCLFFFLTVLVSSSFIELAVGGNESNRIMWILLSSSILLSWIGIRSIAGISWILVMIIGLFFAIDHSYIMGFSGFIYIISAFLGFLLHSGLGPGEFFYELKKEYYPSIKENRKHIKISVRKTGNIIKKL